MIPRSLSAAFVLSLAFTATAGAQGTRFGGGGGLGGGSNLYGGGGFVGGSNLYRGGNGYVAQNAGRLPSNYGTPVVGGQLVPGYGVISNGGTRGPINTASAYNFAYSGFNPYYGTAVYPSGYPYFGGFSGAYGYGYGYGIYPPAGNFGTYYGVAGISAYPTTGGFYSSSYGYPIYGGVPTYGVYSNGGLINPGVGTPVRGGVLIPGYGVINR